MRVRTVYQQRSEVPEWLTLTQLKVLPLNNDKILRGAESNWKATNPHFRTPVRRSTSDDPARVAFLDELRQRRIDGE